MNNESLNASYWNLKNIQKAWTHFSFWYGTLIFLSIPVNVALFEFDIASQSSLWFILIFISPVILAIIRSLIMFNPLWINSYWSYVKARDLFMKNEFNDSFQRELTTSFKTSRYRGCIREDLFSQSELFYFVQQIFCTIPLIYSNVNFDKDFKIKWWSIVLFILSHITFWINPFSYAMNETYYLAKLVMLYENVSNVTKAEIVKIHKTKIKYLFLEDKIKTKYIFYECKRNLTGLSNGEIKKFREEYKC